MESEKVRNIVYILECVDGTLYVGSTNNLERRLLQHNTSKSGAHYTKIRRPVVLRYAEELPTLGAARSREAQIKKLRRQQKQALYQRIVRRIKVKRSAQQFEEHKNEALQFAQSRLVHFNQTYGFRYGKVTIRNQKTRWGSCSSRGNLSFNYRIALIAPALADYVIVHELCHLKEMNHSQKFWNLVAQTLPDWKERRRELRKSQPSRITDFS